MLHGVLFSASGHSLTQNHNNTRKTIATIEYWIPSLPRNKSAVAFIEIFGRADTRDLKRLSPGSCREISYDFDCLGFRFQSCSCGINLNQRFGQNPAVQFLWRCYSEYAQNRWGKIDIASWQIVHLTAAKIRTDCNQHIVHVESAEGGVSPLACSSLPVCVNHSRNTELIFRVIPAESHHHVWRVLTVDLGLLETKSSLHRFLRKNDSGKI